MVQKSRKKRGKAQGTAPGRRGKGGGQARQVGPEVLKLVSSGDTHAVRNLMRNGFDVNGNWKGYSPLGVAAASGRVDMAKLLVDAGADVHLASNHFKFTPLHQATQHGQKEMVEYLLDEGKTDPNITGDQGSSTALHIAAQFDFADVAQVLLHGKADPNIAAANDFRPLHVAAQYGHDHIADVLLRQGKANPNLPSNTGHTPLHIAAQCGQFNVMEVIVVAGGDPNVADYKGYTPLHTAVECGQTAMVNMLIHHGVANPNVADEDGRTPLYTAVVEGHLDIVKTLVRDGRIDINAATDMPTALHAAIVGGHRKIARFLMKHGAVDSEVRSGNSFIIPSASDLIDDDSYTKALFNDSRCAGCNVLRHTRPCAGCRKAHYCSVECQKKHWPEHKVECKAVQKARKEAKAGKKDAQG